jgi:hypothetical protein
MYPYKIVNTQELGERDCEIHTTLCRELLQKSHEDWPNNSKVEMGKYAHTHTAWQSHRPKEKKVY